MNHLWLKLLDGTTDPIAAVTKTRAVSVHDARPRHARPRDPEVEQRVLPNPDNWETGNRCAATDRDHNHNPAVFRGNLPLTVDQTLFLRRNPKEDLLTVAAAAIPLHRGARAVPGLLYRSFDKLPTVRWKQPFYRPWQLNQ